MAELDRQDRRDRKPSDSPSERVIDSRELLGERDVVRIQHGDRVYELRQTRYGKLILTK
jgi:hemin uptake protein HemP